MATLSELMIAARDLGYDHGTSAASWYFDGNTDETTYARVWRGLEDGDPEIMDTLPANPLNGEMADGMTPNKLWEELGVTELQLRNWEHSDELSQLCNVYEEGYDSAVTHSITEACRVHIGKLYRVVLTSLINPTAGNFIVEVHSFDTAEAESMAFNRIGQISTDSFVVNHVEMCADERQ